MKMWLNRHRSGRDCRDSTVQADVTMRAPRKPQARATCARATLALLLLLPVLCESVSPRQEPNPQKLQDGYNTLKNKKLELCDGVYLKFPETNNTGKLFSLEIDTNRNYESGRAKKNRLMERILPLFIMPFLIQSTIVPFFLSTLKFMLFKSMMIGKIALALIILNAFKNHNTFKGRQEVTMADVHYGYHGNGMEEYGAYIN